MTSTIPAPCFLSLLSLGLFLPLWFEFRVCVARGVRRWPTLESLRWEFGGEFIYCRLQISFKIDLSGDLAVAYGSSMGFWRLISRHNCMESHWLLGLVTMFLYDEK